MRNNDNRNWLILPVETLQCIFKYCNKITILMMSFVSVQLRTFVRNNFPFVMKLNTGMYKYGIDRGIVPVIKLASGVNEYHNSDVEIIAFMQKYLDNSGTVSFKLVCRKAAQNGHVEVLRWAYENGSEYVNANSCGYWAVRCGHIDVLEWAVQNGCVVNRVLFNAAIIHNQTDISAWLQTNYCDTVNCPNDSDHNNPNDCLVLFIITLCVFGLILFGLILCAGLISFVLFIAGQI
jgi:hypothetical protein